MKKLIAKMLIIVMLVTFIVPKYTFATDAEEDETEGTGIESDYNVYESLSNTGKVNVNGRKETPNDTPSKGSAVVGLLSTISSFIAYTVNVLISYSVAEGDIKQYSNFTIAGVVSGKYPILNNDFLLTTNESSTNNTIKDSVSEWYYVIRNLSIIISLLVLLYIGIRMAISSLSDDKAKYKKMLISWLQSFVLIFILHYIMIIAMGLQKVLMDLIGKIEIIDGSMEANIVKECWSSILIKNGWNILWYAILYWVMTYYQVKFFFLYAKRMVSTAFLIIIAPLITVTYSIDKVGDNKAQAFDAWLKEFLVNVFIQPVHLLVYIVFIMSASEIAVTLPLFAAIFFGALSRGEKIIKGIFGMRNLKSINSITVKRSKPGEG